MKNKLKIEFSSPKLPDRSSCVKRYALIRGLRLPTAQYVHASKQFGLNKAIDEARYIVKSHRDAYKRAISDNGAQYITITRTLL